VATDELDEDDFIGLDNPLVEHLLQAGPAGYYSSRHKMPYTSINDEGSHASADVAGKCPADIARHVR